MAVNWDVEHPPAWSRLLEPFYRTGAGVYHAVYDRGWRHAEPLPRPALSVGNLAVGGLGKTPAVIGLVEAALARGTRPAVLTRGYGGSGTPVLLGGGSPVPDAAVTGDEPALLTARFPGVPVAVDADRHRGARTVLERHPEVEVFVLDDGFQHRRVRPDLNLVLLDREAPLGNGRCLPAGPLREPPGALARADRWIAVASAPVDRPGGAITALRDRIAPDVPVDVAWPAVDTPRTLDGNAATPEGPWHAVVGIARPKRFLDTLSTRSFDVRRAHVFADHHPFSDTDVRRLEAAAAADGARLVTTTKDAVRLTPRVVDARRWVVLPHRLEVAGGWGRLWENLQRGTQASS